MEYCACIKDLKGYSSLNAEDREFCKSHSVKADAHYLKKSVREYTKKLEQDFELKRRWFQEVETASQQTGTTSSQQELAVYNNAKKKLTKSKDRLDLQRNVEKYVTGGSNLKYSDFFRKHIESNTYCLLRYMGSKNTDCSNQYYLINWILKLEKTVMGKKILDTMRLGDTNEEANFLQTPIKPF